ncbi:AMP-Hypothetical protein enzyme [Nesidiocoris tenuis]|uniref:Luciferin 4-monooxygenase n=1 Tax=Nesidiocoris tenuis TaxID=355587 RepID=A0ABN7AAY6_9HEMI|nr:AMP-Hypothetical protein enzyme [Nesidiocoris tenuis]
MPIGGEEFCDDTIDHSHDLPTVILEKMRQFSDLPFLTDGLLGVTKTFKQTMEAALCIASKLRAMGVGEGTYVAFLADTTVEAFTMEIAVWLAGGCVSPINYGLSTEEIWRILDTFPTTIVYCESDKLPLLDGASEKLNRSLQLITDSKRENFITYDDLSSGDGSSFVPEPYDPYTHVAHLLFTSGTTGVPKGAMLSSSTCLINGARLFEDDSSTFMTSPLYWITNPAVFVYSLLRGTEMIFPRVKYIEGTKEQDLHHLLACIQKYKPGKWLTGPSVLLDLSNLTGLESYDLSSLTHISVGGAPVIVSQKKIICDTLFGGRNIIQDRYGCTEVGAFSLQLKNPLPDYNEKKSASVGPAAPGVTIKVMDVDSGEELGPNEVGEVFVKTNSIMIGYINRDMPQRYTKHDWYRVGDCCMYDEDGWIYFKSRVKEIIKYRGYQMAPVDIEKIAIQHPDVLEACVVGKPHPVDGEHPAAFIVKKGNSDLTEGDLVNFINDRVSDEKKLRGGVIFKNELPKSSVGKVLRHNLVKEFEV